MTHFKTRDHLIEWLEEHAPYRQIRRAMVEGEVELYGYFDGDLRFGSGWVAHIKSKFGKTWLVWVCIDHKNPREYMAFPTHTVLWGYWKGGSSELFQGDHPEKYAKLRDEYNLEP